MIGAPFRRAVTAAPVSRAARATASTAATRNCTRPCDDMTFAWGRCGCAGTVDPAGGCFTRALGATTRALGATTRALGATTLTFGATTRAFGVTVRLAR
jgi:hypothetical protein